MSCETWLFQNTSNCSASDRFYFLIYGSVINSDTVSENPPWRKRAASINCLFSSSRWLLLWWLFRRAEIHLHGGVSPSFWFWFLSGYTFSGQRHVPRFTSTVSTFLRFWVLQSCTCKAQENKTSRSIPTTKIQVTQTLNADRLCLV